MSCEDGDGDKRATEAQVEKDCNDGEKGFPAKEAGQKNSEDCVENASSGDALNCPPSLRNGKMVVGELGEEVRENSQSNCRAEELKEVEEGRDEAESTASNLAHVELLPEAYRVRNW